MLEKTDVLPGEDVPKVDVTQAQDGGIIKQIKRAGSDPGERLTFSETVLQIYTALFNNLTYTRVIMIRFQAPEGRQGEGALRWHPAGWLQV